jgi:hypothetical protein
MPRMKKVEVGQRPSLQRFTLDELAPEQGCGGHLFSCAARNRRGGVLCRESSAMTTGATSIG